VRDGDSVAAGAVIGSVGRTPEGEAQLYFEIRCEGKPVDPTPLLPRRP
jgi:lipoprotein NlpD